MRVNYRLGHRPVLLTTLCDSLASLIRHRTFNYRILIFLQTNLKFASRTGQSPEVSIHRAEGGLFRPWELLIFAQAKDSLFPVKQTSWNLIERSKNRFLTGRS